MAVYTYAQFRRVLRKLGFELLRSRKHETWERIAEDGTVFYVRLSHKGKKDIPKWLFHKLLEQAGITQEEFERLL